MGPAAHSQPPQGGAPILPAPAPHTGAQRSLPVGPPPGAPPTPHGASCAQPAPADGLSAAGPQVNRQSVRVMLAARPGNCIARGLRRWALGAAAFKTAARRCPLRATPSSVGKPCSG